MKHFMLLSLIAMSLVSCDEEVSVIVTHESAAVDPEIITSHQISCTIGSNKASYAVGEVPKMTVMLTNEGDQELVLPRGLDGSEVGWRFPKCGFELYDENKERIQQQGVGRCGNMTMLSRDDFVRLSPNESFNLAENGHGGFAGLYQMSQKPGTYWVRYYYHTSGGKADDYFGDENMMKKPKVDDAIRMLAAEVPKVTVFSNMLKIVIEEKAAD